MSATPTSPVDLYRYYYGQPGLMQKYAGGILTAVSIVVGVVIVWKIWRWCSRRRRNPNPGPNAPRHEAAGEGGGNRSDTGSGFSPELLQLLGSTLKYNAGNPSAASDAEDSRKECVVCLGEFCDGELLRQLNACGHSFHRECVDVWLSKHRSCPLCRSPLSLPQDTNPLEKDSHSPQASVELQHA